MEEVHDSFATISEGTLFVIGVFPPSVGNNGGMMSIWCQSKGNTIFSFLGTCFLGVCVDCGVLKSICFVVNLYAKGSLREKRKLRSELVRLKNSLGGEVWCVVGDFNLVLDSCERRHGVGDRGTRG